jgi:hypothetical protein
MMQDVMEATSHIKGASNIFARYLNILEILNAMLV